MDRAQLVEDLKHDEGWEPYPYRDTEGYLTIGYGFLVDPNKPPGMPRSIGEIWLTHNVDQLYRAVRLSLPWFDSAPEPVQRALCNMAYQLGVSGLLGFKKTLLLIERGRYYEAADEALDSLWAKQTPNRARRVAGLIRSAASQP